MEINDAHLCRLIEIEREQVKPKTPPSPGDDPFLVIERDSPILLSAPHGARTFRNSPSQQWHPHDSYTAGTALLLADLCGTSVIATTRRTDDHDPNYSRVASPYKQRLGQLLQDGNIKWVLDLHGLANRARGMNGYFVDLGVRDLANPSLADIHRITLEETINSRLGAPPGTSLVSCNKWAAGTLHTITSFVSAFPGGSRRTLEAVQIEMKRCVRVPEHQKGKLCHAGSEVSPANRRVIAMMQAITEFIEYLGNVHLKHQG